MKRGKSYKGTVSDTGAGRVGRLNTRETVASVLVERMRTHVETVGIDDAFLSIAGTGG